MRTLLFTFLRRAGLLLVLLFAFGENALVAQPDLLPWCQENQDRVSLYWLEDGEPIAEHQAGIPRPLASTVKLLLAAEFAQRAGKGLMDAELMVPTEGLATFHWSTTDGGAHTAWLAWAREKDLIQDDAVPLWAVVQGMIGFSSNANAEYLMRLLGKEEILDLGRQWGMPSHTPLVPLVGSLVAAQNEPGPPHLRAKALRERPDATYLDNAWTWSDSLAGDYDGRWTTSQTMVDLSLQRVWSSHLSAASATDYANFADRLNQREGLDDSTIPWLEQSVEFWRGNDGAMLRAGGKGGSTGFLLNQCLYATREDGSRFAVALFIHDLNPVEMAILSQSLREFEAQLMAVPGISDEWSHYFPVDGE